MQGNVLTKSLEGLEEQALAGSPEKVPFAHQESSKKLEGEELPQIQNHRI